jgi:tetratricopeptide (TPR) repeat protein
VSARCWFLLSLLLLAVSAARPGPVLAQVRLETLPAPLRSDLQRQRRLAEVDRLLMLQNVGQARTLLNQLELEAYPREELLSYWIRLAQLTGDSAQAVELSREALQTQPRNPRLLRFWAESALEGDDPAGARTAVDSLIAVSPDRQNAFLAGVDILLSHGRPGLALALCDSGRAVLGLPRFLARPRAACLLALKRYAEGADELVVELRRNELNLPLLRTELLDRITDKKAAQAVIKRLEERAAEPESLPGERLLAANLELLWGRRARAEELVSPLLADRRGSHALLQTLTTLASETPLVDDPTQRQALTDFLLASLRELATSGILESPLRPRVLELLAQVCEESLDAGYLDVEPAAAVQRLEDVLKLVREGYPGSRHLYSAQIRLARFTRDVLGRPDEAAARLEWLLTDLDLPLEGVALARLTLGECYLAAGDTLRGRIVLTRLGHDAAFRDAAGHAHFHLARLDLAEGHWETARDRFATVAMDNPRADYANDALDLGLAIAEELDNPTGGPALLDLYARSVQFALTAQPDSQQTALERYVTEAAAQVDLEQPQYLLERARYELARLLWHEGRDDEALAQCDRIVLDHPDGRYPAEALVLAGRIHEERDEWEEAREVYERLLLQYPDHLFADDVRDRLKGLP